MREVQTADAVLMIRPAQFAANPETRSSNAFQARHTAPPDAARAARREFDALAAALERAGVRVLCFEGRHAEGPDAAGLPDEVFPNNWISTHADGAVVLYPMLAPNRRRERRPDIIAKLQERHGYRVVRVVDLSPLEQRGVYLEGTGSLVLDRGRRIAYACRSARTDAAAAVEFAHALNYELLLFDALDTSGMPIYHTNVMMSVGTGFAVVCSASLPDAKQRRRLLDELGRGGRALIDLAPAQLAAFAANLIELRGASGPVIALSRSAADALTAAQHAALARQGQLVVAAIDTIETLGGGSVRCMLAEIHLPRAAAPHAGFIPNRPDV
jgi:hypothetical protein